MTREEILKEIDEAMAENKAVKVKVNEALSHARNIVNKEDDSEAYNKGLNDGENEVWKLIKKLSNIPNLKAKEIFGYEFLYGIVENFTPQEALAKLEVYEKAQAEIKVGDVVVIGGGDIEYVCTKDNSSGDYTRCHLLSDDGSVWEDCDKKNLVKTGKHIDIQSVLEQIGGVGLKQGIVK